MISALPLPSQPHHHSKTERWCHLIGLVSLFIYAFTWQLSLDISRSFEPLIMLVYVIALCAHPQRLHMLRDPLWGLLGIWVVLQFVTIPIANALFPDHADAQIKDMRHLSKVFFILPIAWLLAGRTRNGLWMLSLLFVGMLLGGLFLGESWSTLAHYIQAGKRPRLGFKNWEHAGVCAGVMMIALSCFLPRFLRWSGSLDSGLMHWGTRLGYTLAVILAVTGWLITRTRASWLGIVVILLIALIGVLWLLGRGHVRSRRTRFAILYGFIGLALVMTVIGALFGDAIISRVFAEHHVVLEVLSGDLSNVPYSSIGFRIHAWHYALQLIAERPWFGWGPQSHIPLLLSAPNPELKAQAVSENLTHFHNSYITLLVGNGVLGFAMFVAIAGVVGRAAWQSWRQGAMPNDVMIFLSLFFIFWVIVNCFESYVGYRTGIYLDGLIGGLAYSYAMRLRLEGMNKATSKTGKITRENG
ncbi:O-antigen ligase family protein [Kushneria phosphatilytica]|uniref:O-antigen ligase family protein n=1 Tax=Kushneria phosphatilytica TaxID=657387 RepID=A0A1S1NP28_9GAMM|nr:O-antigen ligase family protein [Kushneria phosphatilytica]OHV09520.1 hypothetical protein BH688_11000 [Kushneria phosphatilytica]QEL11803.1 O-antigen ligase family protein [Kushneria phosphatilytica]